MNASVAHSAFIAAAVAQGADELVEIVAALGWVILFATLWWPLSRRYSIPNSYNAFVAALCRHAIVPASTIAASSKSGGVAGSGTPAGVTA